MRSSFKRASRQTRQAGLSLIELLIALALGVVIVAAMSQLFVNISQNNQEMAKTNSQIENARFALQFLRDDVVHAGFWGEFVPDFDNISYINTPVDAPSAVPDPCLAYGSWDQDHVDNLIGVAIAVHDGIPGTCGGVVQDRVPNTDVLVVRHANNCEPGMGNCSDTGGAGQLYFRTSLCNDDPAWKRDPSGPADEARPYLLSNVNDPNEPQNIDCTGLAPRRKFVQSIYYIRDYADTAGDGIPTLVRSLYEFDGALLEQQEPVPLVEGIQDFRVELGIDSQSEPYPGFPNGSPADPNEAIDWEDEDYWDTPTNRGDGIPDGNFVHCGSGCTTHQLVHAVAAKIYVLARANEPTQGYTDDKTYTLGASGAIGPFNDSFKRHVFSTTVRFNNVSARRETP